MVLKECGVLYASSATGAAEALLKGLVDVVVDLRSEDDYDVNDSRALHSSMGVAFHSFPTDDEVRLDVAYFEAVTELVHTQLAAGLRVLVHCEAGMSRTAAVVMAYLVRYRGLTAYEALEGALASRDAFWPHEEMWVAVNEYARSLGRKAAPLSGDLDDLIWEIKLRRDT